MPMCTWGMWSENMECRVDTHGAMKKNLSRFGGRNPEKFNFENLVFHRKDGKKGMMEKFHKNGWAHAFIKRHVHVPMCTWCTWSENMECRGDTHGAMKKNLSRFGGRKPSNHEVQGGADLPPPISSVRKNSPSGIGLITKHRQN